VENKLCKIVFEIGPTHSGLRSALSLIGAAAAAGADAVKFQMIDADKLMNNPHQEFSYGILNNLGRYETVSESLYEILKRRELTKDEWLEIISFTKMKGLEFYTTVTTLEELEFALVAGVDSIKIASGDITFHQLIREAAKSGLLVQIDTGNATMEEIEEAINVIRSCGNNSILVHHCPPGYPARDDEVFIETLSYIKEKFDVEAAFSDHSPGWHMDIAALSKGVSLIEKTLTLNKETRSPEHMFSLTPEEATIFVKQIRSVESALKPGIRTIDENSKIKMRNVRRSPYAISDMSAGEIVEISDVIYQRPAISFEPNEFESYVGKKLLRPIKKGQAFAKENFEN
jgi:N,N'-diacetyllegionaminate synthase